VEYDSSNACGGGIYCANSSINRAVINNNIIQYNFANAGGGGISCGHGGRGIVINNVIYKNKTNYEGGGFFAYDRGGAIATNNIFRADSGSNDNEINIYRNSIGYSSFSYCNVEGGYSGNGNIDFDPLFKDAAICNFRLMSIACGDSINSPCIDAGDPSLLDSLRDCSWGLGVARSDMGAFGGTDSLIVEVNEAPSSMPQTPLLSQNYPNPFNPTTTIAYFLPQASHVSLDIFDILGRKVINLVNEIQPAGYHRAVWNSQGAASGIYFYMLQTDEQTETKRMTLLR
jgi:hypothetical protein